ncbi:MAG: class I SAM-dependent methyltransferase [Phycisphaerales bacterium]|nr:class I SAM-dependent methyltransferase [Phycisphaerales bacterium]
MVTTAVADWRDSRAFVGQRTDCGVCNVPLRPYARIDARYLGETFYSAELRALVPSLEYARCSCCGSIWASDARRDPELLARLYGALPEDYWTALAHPTALYHRIDDLLQAYAPGRIVCDIGCGDGRLLQALSARWIKLGIEPGAVAVQRCRAAGLDVRLGTPARRSDLPPCDALTCIDTLEHMPDPAAELQAMVRLLRPGGVLVLFTGDPSRWTARLAGQWWEYLHCVGHIAVLSRAALRDRLQAAGCEVRRMETVPHAGGVGLTAWWRRWLENHWRCRRGQRYRPMPYCHDHQWVVATKRPTAD